MGVVCALVDVAAGVVVAGIGVLRTVGDGVADVVEGSGGGADGSTRVAVAGIRVADGLATATRAT